MTFPMVIPAAPGTKVVFRDKEAGHLFTGANVIVWLVQGDYTCSGLTTEGSVEDAGNFAGYMFADGSIEDEHSTYYDDAAAAGLK